MHHLALKEQGLPAEIALRVAARQGLIPPERLAELRTELYGLTEEVTVKFVGFFAAKSVRTALKLTLGIVSLGLEFGTEGAYQPEAWVIELRAIGFKGLAARAVALFKEIAALPAVDALESIEEIETGTRDVKQLILNCFLSRPGKPEGYRWYASELRSRSDFKTLMRIHAWFVRAVAGIEPEIWIERRIQRDGAAVPLASNVVNSVFLRASLGLEPGLELTYAEFIAGHKALKQEGKAGVAKARKRFEAYARKLPAEFRDEPFVKDWFKPYLQGAFRHAFGKDRGINYFHVVSIPSSVQDRAVRAESWVKGIPRSKRWRVNP